MPRGPGSEGFQGQAWAVPQRYQNGSEVVVGILPTQLFSPWNPMTDPNSPIR
ncbi:hypothetical protein G443_001940 [Actinoalloteichus cyanogriseus DSM 43889]|uniref:Uncharacterized protein n=1 Tax=Actinoalloteichus caeruleus DSM 43889 TaxID=1120930 RepID=A0ABT1JGQ0_ACTCY|nr:hypothetical protein [Actinoalloteichus caeruleus DSM 43889]